MLDEFQRLFPFVVPMVIHEWRIFQSQRVKIWGFFQQLVQCPNVAIGGNSYWSYILFQKRYEPVFHAKQLRFMPVYGDEFD